MPFYEFKCDKCGAVTERFRHFDNSQAPVKCECGEDAQRIFSTFNFAFSPLLKGTTYIEYPRGTTNEYLEEMGYEQPKQRLKACGGLG